MKKHILMGMILGFCLSLIVINNPLLSVYGSNHSNIKHTLADQLDVELPQSTKVMETQITEAGQLNYSIYLDDQIHLIRGYLQIWNLDDLEDYLVNSKRISTFDFHSYYITPVKIAALSGYLTEWTASFGQSYKISGMEYWLKNPVKEDEVLRISFFTDTASFSKEQQDYMQQVISSLKWKN